MWPDGRKKPDGEFCPRRYALTVMWLPGELKDDLLECFVTKEVNVLFARH